MPFIAIGIVLGLLYLASKKTADAPKRLTPSLNRAAAPSPKSPAQAASPGALGAIGDGIFENARRITRSFSEPADDGSVANAVTAGAGAIKSLGAAMPGLFKDLGISQQTNGSSQLPAASQPDAATMMVAQAKQDMANAMVQNVLYGGYGQAGGNTSDPETANGLESGNDLGFDNVNSTDDNYANTFTPGSAEANDGSDAYTNPQSWDEPATPGQDINFAPPAVDGDISNDPGVDVDSPIQDDYQSQEGWQ